VYSLRLLWSADPGEVVACVTAVATRVGHAGRQHRQDGVRQYRHASRPSAAGRGGLPSGADREPTLRQALPISPRPDQVLLLVIGSSEGGGGRKCNQITYGSCKLLPMSALS
jgi:hypothetical protein